MTRRARKPHPALALLLAGAFIVIVGLFVIPHVAATTFVRGVSEEGEKPKEEKKEKVKALDTKAYDQKMQYLAHIDPAATSTATSSARLWPVTDAPYPKAGAILPFKRIVAYYGNFYSTKMGILGEFDEETVLAKLKSEKAAWEAADPQTPVVMAVDYIAITAQGTPQADNTYKLRMPEEHVRRAIDMARKVEGITILEMQIGYSTLERELPLLEKYLTEPDVHLALDPEFSMKAGALPPGDEIGTFSAADINYAISYLSDIVKQHDLPPKVLLIHRFTQNMVTNAAGIAPTPEVQVVMVMDGWGFGAKKINTYNSVIKSEPVQFTGFKLFYKNDLKAPSTRLLAPAEILELTPSPSFIQYQ